MQGTPGRSCYQAWLSRMMRFYVLCCLYLHRIWLKPNPRRRRLRKSTRNSWTQLFGAILMTPLMRVKRTQMSYALLRVFSACVRLRHFKSPPIQWLQMTHGTGRVFHAVWQWLSDDETSVAMKVLIRPPILKAFNEELWAESNRQRLEYLLQRSQADVINEP